MDKLDEAQIGIIMAGLRLIQRQGIPDDLMEVATNGFKFDPLDDDEIDALCEQINV